MVPLLRHHDPNWANGILEQIVSNGYAVVEGVLSVSFIKTTRESMYRAQEKIVCELGPQRLSQAGERGVLRLMMKYHPHFFKFLEIPELLTVVDSTLSNTAIMHLQNGFILPTVAAEQNSGLFQHSFHQDFPRFLNGYRASINLLFAIDEFTEATGATRFVPNTHQQAGQPDQDYLRKNAVSVECPAGSMIVFDSTLWHASGTNSSGKDRLAINHQFTRSYIKQQIDYVRALGDEIVLTQPPRTQQLLGWHTRVVTSLDEYYRPEHERLYRKGQG